MSHKLYNSSLNTWWPS